MKQLLYRGYTIIEQSDGIAIYKGDFLVKRIETYCSWHGGVSTTKCKIDNYIKRFENVKTS